MLLSQKFNKKRILLSPLDWGLGHATRCIPIIHCLQNLGCKTIIASSGDQLALLLKEFPNLEFIDLPGYNVRYSVSKRFFSLKILQQVPKILQQIRRENLQLQKIIEDYKIDIVISDNRYGLYSGKVPSVFITHQLNVQAGSHFLNRLIQNRNYKFINLYNECWIPDFEGKNNIAGILSHPKNFPAIPTKFIGPLSRFKKNIARPYNKKYLIVLSGPEPQRTILEKKLLQIVPKLDGKILIVRGKPSAENIERNSENCEIINHLDTKNLQNAFDESEFVISRSGYTTIMELLSLQKKSILIPTPGQTEQEYLAQHLMQQNWCYSCAQDDDLLLHIYQAEKFSYKIPEIAKENLLERAIIEMLERYS